MTKKKTISATEYAERREVSLSVIMKHIREGRLTAKKIGSTWRIDPELADKELDETAPVDSVQDEDDGELPSFAESRAKKEAYAARLKKLEYQRERGELVRIEDVRRDAYAAGKLVQQKMLAIPDRLAGQLAGMTEIAAIKRVLVEEIRYALSEVAND